MADLDFLLNRWLSPALITVLFLLYHSNRTRVDRWVVGKTKNPNMRKYNRFLLNGLDVRIYDWRFTIIAPIFLSLSLDFLISFLLNQPLKSYVESVWFASLTSGFMNPISEEILIHGIVLSLFVFVAKYPITDKYKYFVNLHRTVRKYKYFVYFIGLIATSYLFTINHANPFFGQFVLRFASSMLYGILYLISNRNLLPPIIAHAASNWFLILNDMKNLT